MKILMINKFLHPNGDSETYIFKLGAHLQSMGHEVQYFGMEHEGRIVGNRAEAYTSTMDFHSSGLMSKVSYAFRTVYSAEARRKLRLVLDDFMPDVCHLNNFNYQLTPSIILEIRKWEKRTGHPCKILYTAHDYQLVCPNHMCYNPNSEEICEQCLGGHYLSCTKGRCIHGSPAKSAIGTLEAALWNVVGVYKEIDTIICCSAFMKSKLDTNPVLAEKTVTLHNFVDTVEWRQTEKKDYVLYFGRYSMEKGIGTLIQAARALPEIPFIFAGTGPLETELEDIPNVRNVGFQSGEALETWIREAKFTVYPSEWYENCPFSVMESQMYGTPVLGADIGGIPELIRNGETGELFESRNAEELTGKIKSLWQDADRLKRYSENCKNHGFDTVEEYTRKMMKIAFREMNEQMR